MSHTILEGSHNSHLAVWSLPHRYPLTTPETALHPSSAPGTGQERHMPVRRTERESNKVPLVLLYSQHLEHQSISTN